jgi:hypothetical protein
MMAARWRVVTGGLLLPDIAMFGIVGVINGLIVDYYFPLSHRCKTVTADSSS